MPRVLRIINRLNLGGISYNVAYLSKYLAPEFETMILSGIKLDSEESSGFILDQLGLKAIYLPEMRREINWKNDRAAYLKIKSIIREFKPDIVHTHAAKAGTLGRLAAAKCGVKTIVHTFHGHVFHSYFSPLKTKLFIQIEKYLASKSTRIIAISDIQKKEICEDFNICKPEKAVVIPLGFDLQRFRDNQEEKRKSFRGHYKISDDEIAIGIIGRITAIKNHDLFLRAFGNAISKTVKKVKAVIVGDGEDLQKMQNLCRELGLKYSENNSVMADSQVVFTSWIKNVDWAIAGLDIIAMTSLNEGTPVSLIEAQAANKPVVSTNVGGIENVVIRDITGLLSPSQDVNSFSENLLRLIEDESMRNKIAQKGWEHVGTKFHYTRLVENVRKLYHELLNQ
ncbi:MAG TPA: glycosyltransferase [Bacteroidia bacterium]|nr:glycosyltransferase [Bacteroidia bacterium]